MTKIVPAEWGRGRADRFRGNGFRVYFYSRETSEPPHVHIDRGGATVKAWLETLMLASNAGFPARELSGVLALVRENRQMFFGGVAWLL